MPVIRINKAPWSQEEVDYLNELQQKVDRHQLKCANKECNTVLTAKIDGLVCEKCGFIQDWYSGTPFRTVVKHEKEENVFIIRSDDRYSTTTYLNINRVNQLKESLDFLCTIQSLTKDTNIYSYNFASAAIAAINGLLNLIEEVNHLEEVKNWLEKNKDD